MASGTSQGVQLLTQPQQIQQTHQFDLMQLNQQAPLHGLQKAWKVHSKNDAAVPLHLIIALYADSAEAIAQGNFNQTTIISCDEDNGSITLAHPLQAGQFLSWSFRATAVAESDFAILADRLRENLGCSPDFALLFSCLGRGPYFYNGIDRDLNIITKTFPNTPVLGFYGNGEIAYLNGEKSPITPLCCTFIIFSGLDNIDNLH
jgi:small ligand-binding sensory domain FIST